MAHSKAMTTAERFFWKHAGYSVTQGETKAQGKRRCAIALAEAEAYAQDAAWEFDWSDSWDCDHEKEYGYTPETCESCLLTDADGHILASLSCIDDVSNEQRRVIEAELAMEAYDDIKQAQRNDSTVYDYCAL